MEQKNFIELSKYTKESINENSVIFDTNVLVDLFYPGNINQRTQKNFQNCKIFIKTV